MGTTTTEVAIRSTLTEDIYAIMNTVNPQTKLGTFRVIVRPFVAWIWLGGLFMILGSVVSLSPSVREVLGELPKPAKTSGGFATTAAIVALVVLGAGLLFRVTVAQGQNDSSSSLHAGSVTMRNPEERQLFERLLCECGDCQRLPLSTCSCGWAEDMRAKLRGEMAEGKSPLAIQNEYRDEFGAQSIAIPSDQGLDRALWAVPVLAITVALGGLFFFGRRWMRPPATTTSAAAEKSAPDHTYDDRLDDELSRLDE